MNLKAAVATGVGSAVVATAMWLGLHAPASEIAKGKIPKDRIDAMVFPKGAKLKGDKDGILCHQIVGPDGTVFKIHRIEGKDVRGMTEAQIMALIIADTQADLEEDGIACNSAAPPIFSEALADSVKRCDSCGSDCWITSCPAHTAIPYCQLTGENCVISFICCGGAQGGCPATCGA